MKNVNIDFEKINSMTVDIPEKSTQYDIEVSAYDSSAAALEFEEDLTEKIITFIEFIRSDFFNS